MVFTSPPGVCAGACRGACQAPSVVALAVVVEHREQVNAVRDGLPERPCEPGEVDVVLAEQVAPLVEQVFEIAGLREQSRVVAALVVPGLRPMEGAEIARRLRRHGKAAVGDDPRTVVTPQAQSGGLAGRKA